MTKRRTKALQRSREYLKRHPSVANDSPGMTDRQCARRAGVDALRIEIVSPHVDGNRRRGQ